MGSAEPLREIPLPLIGSYINLSFNGRTECYERSNAGSTPARFTNMGLSYNGIMGALQAFHQGSIPCWSTKLGE